MQYKSTKGYTGTGQIGMLLLFIGAGLILSVILQLVMMLQMMPPGVSVVNMQEEMEKVLLDPHHVNAIRFMQVFSTLLMFFLPAVAYSWVCNGKQPQWLGFNRHFNVFQVMLGFMIIFSANIMAGPVQDLSENITSHFPSIHQMAQNMEDLYNRQVGALSHINGVGDLAMAIVIMAFFPALFEELFFRGALQSLLVRWWQKPAIAILVTSIIFSLIHFSIFLFLSRLILGIVLGWMFYETKNIWVNTIAHFLNNSIAVFQMYFLSSGKEKIDVSKLDPKIDWWMGLIALVVVVFLFKILKKYSEKPTSEIQMEENAIYKKENIHLPFGNNDSTLN